MSSEKMRKLIQDYQRDIAAYLAPESGISERQLLQQLASRLDGQQAQDALGNGWQAGCPMTKTQPPQTTAAPRPRGGGPNRNSSERCGN